MNKYQFIFSLCALTLSSLVFAEDQDLLMTYQQALENDPVLQQAIANQLATKQGVPIAASQLLPQASVQFYSESQNAFLFPGSVPQDIGTGIQRSHGYIASATQNLINFNTWSLISEARRLAEEADATFLANEQDLITRVANAYFNVLAAQDTLTFATAQKEALGSQLNQVQQRFDVGLVAITDVYDFQAQYDSQVAEEISAYNEVANAKEALQVITGIPVDEVAALLPSIPLHSPNPMDMNAWVEQAEYDNPTLAAARFNMQAAEETISTERSLLYPNLQVTGEYGNQFNGQVTDPQSGSSTGWAVAVESNLNLFSGGQIISQVRQAEYQYQSARDNYEEQRRNTVNQTRSAYRAIETAISQVKALEQSVISAKSALDANQASYEVGIKTSVDVLDSISLLYQQEQNLANAKYNYILSILSLKQATGVLEVMDLIQINEWLQDLENF
ncbi:MAG: TolC family outer membrane protein [Legionellales bacterium]|jgi:outer membrane protein